jgi:hypothetical protein
MEAVSDRERAIPAEYIRRVKPTVNRESPEVDREERADG